MNEAQNKKAALLWQQLEVAGKEWQKRLGTGSMVIPLYELRRYWTELTATLNGVEHPLEKQAREFELSRLRAELDWLRKSLAHAVAGGPKRTADTSNTRAVKSN